MSIKSINNGSTIGMADKDTNPSRPTPMIGNINSPSVSLASVSSDDGSNNGLASTDMEVKELNQEVRRFKEALARLRRVFQDYPDNNPDLIRKASHERLGEVLRILRQMLEKYKSLQTDELVGAASLLIDQVKHFNPEDVTAASAAAATAAASSEGEINPKDFYEALDALASAFTSRVSEYVVGDLEANAPASGAPRTAYLEHSRRPVLPYGDTDDDLVGEDVDPSDLDTALLTVDQIDTILMRHDRGVDMALDRAKIWAKYSKDVMTYVEKRISLELDWAKNLTKLAQERRPVLKEESHLPFQSIYCFALDIDLEMCASTQQTCSLLQDYKFMEPLTSQRAKHEKARKNLKDRWNKERKRLKDAVIQLKKAKELYYQRHQEYERCREALRIAEQGAEIGATGENKVDKRKRLEEDALQKTAECEAHYRSCVDEANDRHRNILLVKTEILRGVRELIVECDKVMKEVTVNYFQQLHSLMASVPTQYLTLCESSRLYEPGSQFMEYVKRMPESQVLHSSTMSDPFSFEPFPPGIDAEMASTAQRISKSRLGRPSGFSLESSSGASDESLQVLQQAGRRREAWTPSMGAIDPSDTESVESGRSSPSGSPLVSTGQDPQPGSAGGDHPVIYFENDDHHHHPAVMHHHARAAAAQQPPAKPLAAAAPPALPPAAAAAASVDHSDHVALPTSPTTPPRRIPMSKAAVSHRFRKIKTPSKCRECDNLVVYFNGFDCQECGLSSHKKCLATLALQCGHRRLPRKIPIFGVDLSAHLLETSAQVPPIVVKCVQEINSRGLKVQGIYRVSGSKQRIDRLSQAFENGPDLVDLTNIPPNVIADVLKNYMRQLPEPLLPAVLCPDFIRVAEAYPVSASAAPTNLAASSASSTNDKDQASSSLAPLASAECSSPTQQQQQSSNASSTSSLTNMEDDQRMAISRLRELCRRLPKAHYFTLGYLMHHLSKVAAENEANSMTASNLAIVFAPTLMKTSQESISIGAVGETKHHARVIELLIMHATNIFGLPELVTPSGGRSERHHHLRGARARGASGRNRSSRDNSDLISSQTERRGLENDEFSIPGLVSSLEHASGSNEDIFGASVSDDDDDAEPIPLFLLDGSSKSGRSPLLMRGNSSPPKIIKQSLKNFSGLEGVTPGMLSTQDSLEVAQRALTSSASLMVTSSTSSSVVPAATAKRSVHHESSMPVASTTEAISTSVFHRMNQRVMKKDSVDEEFFDLEGVEAATTTTTSTAAEEARKTSPPVMANLATRSVSSSAVTTSSARSGSLSEDVASAASSASRRRVIGPASRSTSSLQQGAMSQSMPSTILNLEDNRVTIQVPGVQSDRIHDYNRTTTSASHHLHHPAVVKQTSVDKDDAM